MPQKVNQETIDMIYKKHQNIIDGIYVVRHPHTWEDIPKMDKIDADDEDGELYSLYKDIRIIEISDIPGLINPIDKINIKDYVFILIRDGQYYICETQGLNYIKFASNISDVHFIKLYDRMLKLYKLYEKTNFNIKPLL